MHTLELFKTDITDWQDLNKIHKEFKLIKEVQGNKEFIIYTYSSKYINFKYYKSLIIRDKRLTKVNNITHKKELEYLKIIVNPSKLLNKEIITNQDYIRFKEKFYNAYYEVLNTPIDLENSDNTKLDRIDYKFDFYTPYKRLYLKLLSKTSPNKFLKESKKSNTYYSSNSYNVNLYDKLEEREVKEQSLDIDKLEQLLRLEIQLKKDRINYNYNHDGITPILLNYWNKSDHTYYLNYCLRNIIHKGDYYNLYHAQKIINSNYGEATATKIIQFMKFISLNGTGEAKEKYSTYKYKTYIQKLESININPITIPKNDKSKLTYLDSIFNFSDDNTYLKNDFDLIHRAS